MRKLEMAKGSWEGDGEGGIFGPANLAAWEAFGILRSILADEYFGHTREYQWLFFHLIISVIHPFIPEPVVLRHHPPPSRLPDLSNPAPSLILVGLKSRMKEKEQ
jgi:hypothetical protein